jgi:hypothetical protein
MAETGPALRDRHLHLIAKKRGMEWQLASGYNQRAKSRGDWTLQTGDRRLGCTHAPPASGGRGGRRHPSPAPPGGGRTPELRRYRMAAGWGLGITPIYDPCSTIDMVGRAHGHHAAAALVPMSSRRAPGFGPGIRPRPGSACRSLLPAKTRPAREPRSKVLIGVEN